jgi:hypothetical protein
MLRSGIEPKKQVAKFVYDVEKHGGAIGAIAVQGNGLPSDAIIVGGMIHVETALTSDGAATVAIGAVDTSDILAATDVASLTLNALLDTVPDGTAANAIRLTDAINAITFTVGTADLTAGKISVAVEYF